MKHGGNERLYTIMLQLAELMPTWPMIPKKHSAVNVLRAARALLAEAPWAFNWINERIANTLTYADEYCDPEYVVGIGGFAIESILNMD